MMSDEQIVEHLRSSNADYREMAESHHRLDAELETLLQNHTLTPQEELLKKQIQKEKLGKKDRMAEMVREYRNEQERSTA
jgi:uncharacterized protein YdcH (DUF465 family)